MCRVLDLVAGKDVTSGKLPEIGAWPGEERRVVIRVTRCATFATSPGRVCEASGIGTLACFTGSGRPW